MFKLNRMLLEAAAEGGGGAAAPAAPNPVIAALVDKPADAPKLPEGMQMVKTADYDKLVSDHKTAVEKVVLGDELTAATKVLYAKNPGDEAAQRAAYRKVLNASGEHTVEETDQLINDAFQTIADPAAPPAADPAAAPAAAPKAEADHSGLALKGLVDKSIKDASSKMLGEGDLKVILDAALVRAKNDPKDEGYVNTRQYLADQVEATLRANLVTRKNTEGVETMSANLFGWIDSMVSDAATSVAGKARLITGDPKTLGKTPGVAADANPYANVLDKDPVAPANYDAAKGDLDKRTDERMADRFAREAAAAHVAP